MNDDVTRSRDLRRLPMGGVGRGGDARIYVGCLDDEDDVAVRQLPPSEQIVARGLSPGRLRRRYIRGRLFIREVIAKELGVEQFDEPFLAGCFGKPRIPHINADIRFNVSHAASFIVCAASFNTELGVDIERLGRPIPHFALERIFDSEERQRFDRSPDPAAAALLAWTSKEAVLKYFGVGLTVDPSSIRVPPPTGEGPFRAVFNISATRGPEMVQLYHIGLGRSFIGTVVEGVPSSA